MLTQFHGWFIVTSFALQVALLAVHGGVARAQPTSAPTSQPAASPTILPLPGGTRLTVPQGTFQGYNLSEFKTLLRIHADYQSWGQQLPLLKKNIKQYQELAGNLANQLKLQEKESIILKKERERLFKKWKEDNRLRHLAENKPSFMLWFGWGSAAVMGTVATVLAVVLAVKEK